MRSFTTVPARRAWEEVPDPYNGVEADRGLATLQALLARGQATELVHFALGIAAWERGKPEQARIHLEQASRIAPQMPSVANNLAWVLAHAEPPDLPRALRLVDQAIERWPDQPRCRGTRGYILVKMRRWKEDASPTWRPPSPPGRTTTTCTASWPRRTRTSASRTWPLSIAGWPRPQPSRTAAGELAPGVNRPRSALLRDQLQSLLIARVLVFR